MSENVKHTPGPWLRDRSSGYSCDVRASNGRRIAAVNVQNAPKSPEAAEGRKRENEANARLIAAAPELLEALKGLLSDIEEYQEINKLGGKDNHWQVISRAAIAKAEPRP